MKYRLSEIAALTGGRLCGEDLLTTGVVTDSRSCTFDYGALFVAMRGERHDSHAFLRAMYDRGVRAFMVEREEEAAQLPEDAGYVVVDRAIDALQRWAAEHRKRFRGKVVGITGSNGKTVVKEWLAASLPDGVKSFRSPRSFNSQLGVALSILLAEGDEQVVILEAGISECGEMERLERMIRPDIVILTSIGAPHSEHFSSDFQKCREKLVLARAARTIIYYGEGELPARMIREEYADRRLIDAAAFKLSQAGGGFPAANAALVEACCTVLGYNSFRAEWLQPVAMRLELKEGLYDSVLIDDAWSADLNSLSIALDCLHDVASSRRSTLILSDIDESGMDDRSLYAAVAELVGRAGVDRLIGVGERIARTADLFRCSKAFYRTTEELIERITRDDVADRAVLIKGSRRSRMERVVHALERKSHTTVLEVDLDAMIRNLNYFRKKLRRGTRLVAMVKAGSYGAGDFEVAQMLQHQGVDFLAVAFADEGVKLRERGITIPIVVLNADEGSFDVMIGHRLEPEIYNFRSLGDFARAVAAAGESAWPIHIKLDTGMHRLGFVEEELPELADRLKGMPEVKVASIFSHLSCADEPSMDDYTRAQIARYDRMSGYLKERLPEPVIRHTANSAAIERFPEAQYDMCRLGLGLYGFGYRPNAALTPVSTLRTRIVQIKRHLKAGDAVGYGRAGVLGRETVTATIPMGYADGLDRHLGCGRWSVLVCGKRAPIVGRICMDSCMIDITDIPEAREGDEAVIFSPRQGHTAEDMARVLGTISYEVLTSVSGRVKRIYKKE